MISTYQLIQDTIRSTIRGSDTSKFSGIKIEHPNKESMSSKSPFSLSFIQQVFNNLNVIGTIAPYFLLLKFKTKFCGSSPALFKPNLGIRSPLRIIATHYKSY